MESKRVFILIEVSLLLSVLLLSVLLSGFYLLIPLSLIFILSVFHHQVVLRIISKLRFWILIFSPILVCALLVGQTDLSIYNIKLSSTGIMVGMNMAARAICMILAVAILVSQVSLSMLIRFFKVRGLKGLGLSIGVAYNMLFTLTRIGRVVFETLRLRGMVRRHPMRSLMLFIVAVISSTLQHGDDIVNAATVRGFDTK